MIETRRLKNVVIFVQTILSFVLSRKINYYSCKKAIKKTNKEKLKGRSNILCQANQEILKASKNNRSSRKALYFMCAELMRT